MIRGKPNHMIRNMGSMGSMGSINIPHVPHVPHVPHIPTFTMGGDGYIRSSVFTFR